LEHLGYSASLEVTAPHRRLHLGCDDSDSHEQVLDTVEILESYVPDSRVHDIIDNPTDAVIAEG
jgi:hypothetical protein